MRVRAVMFDAVGTLIRPEPGVAEAYFAVGRQFGSALGVEQIAARFRAAFAASETVKDGAPNSHRTSQAAERFRWQRVVASVFEDLPSAAGEPFEALWNHFAQPNHWRLFDDVADVWRCLEDAGLTLGVASNFDDRLEPVCRGLPPLADCPRVFWSARVHHAKPSREFFLHIQQELALAPEEILLVGDDFANDYLGATSAGWQALHLDRHGREIPPGPQTIHGLEELPKVLGL